MGFGKCINGRGALKYFNRLWKIFFCGFSISVFLHTSFRLPVSDHQSNFSLRNNSRPPQNGSNHRLLFEWQRSFRRNGLGNQLFWFASLLGIARKNNMLPIIPSYLPLPTLFPHFNVKTVTGKEFDWMISKARDLPEHQTYSKICCIYLPFTEKIWSFAESDIILRGSFQSFKYFHPESETIVKSALRFSPAVIRETEEILAAIQNTFQVSNRVRIGIHARRGDVEKTHLRYFGHKPPTKSYYDKARDLMQKRYKNVLFIVTSNDLIWAKQAIHGANVFYVEDPRPEISIAVMSRMDHLIISVGTFSWWCGYLSNATDILYYSGSPQPGSFYDVTFRAEDYWLSHWQGLSD